MNFEHLPSNLGEIEEDENDISDPLQRQAKHRSTFASVNELKNHNVDKNDSLSRKLDFLM